jgi:hypothetical protein
MKEESIQDRHTAFANMIAVARENLRESNMVPTYSPQSNHIDEWSPGALRGIQDDESTHGSEYEFDELTPEADAQVQGSAAESTCEEILADEQPPEESPLEESSSATSTQEDDMAYFDESVSCREDFPTESVQTNIKNQSDDDKGQVDHAVTNGKDTTSESSRILHSAAVKRDVPNDVPSKIFGADENDQIESIPGDTGKLRSSSKRRFPRVES